jgi:hypothetical protein
MANKKNIKVRDLKPSKDAKGGGGHTINSGPGVNAGGVNHGPGVNKGHKIQGHHKAIN